MKMFRWLISSARPSAIDAPQSVVEATSRFEAFEVRSSSGGVLRARIADGLVIHAASAPNPDMRDIALFRLPEAPQFGFLACPGPVPFELGVIDDPLRAPILSYRLRRHGGADTAVLRQCLAELYLCAVPASVEADLPVAANRPDVAGWEVLRLARLAPGPQMAPSIATALGSVLPVLRSGLSPARLLDWLSSVAEPSFRIVGVALLRLLPPATLSAVAGAALARRDLADRLAALWPAGHWANALMPDLERWQRGRPCRQTVDVGPEFDHLDEIVASGRPTPDLAPHLAAAARRQVEPTKGVAVLAIARNEGIYIVDWIAHHRAIGVEHFFLYTNDNNDASDELLSCLAAAGIVTHLTNRIAHAASGQRKAYNHASLCLPEILDYRWTATIDIDEFIVVDPTHFPSLAAFLDLQEQRGADAVALNWRFYSPAAQLTFSDRPVTSRFLRRHPHLDHHVKTIARSNLVWGGIPHAPLWPDRACSLTLDASGKPHHVPGVIGGPGVHRANLDAGPAWINHYHLKSLPEYVWKSARNDGDHAEGRASLRFSGRFLASFVEDFDNPAFVEDRHVLAMSDAVTREREVLMRLPGVAVAHAACVRIFRGTVAGLIAGIPARAGTLAGPSAAFLDLVARSTSAGIVADA